MLTRALALALVLAPLPALADKADPPPGPYLGVAARIDGRFVAKWTIDRVSLSADGGNTFVEVLARAGEVGAVAIDRDGSVYVVRAGELGVRDAKGQERWQRVDLAKVRDIAVAGPNVVLLGEPIGAAEDDRNDTFLVSIDGARSFAPRAQWEVGNFQTTIALGADGTIDYISGWEARCGGGYQSRWRGPVASEVLPGAAWQMDAPTTATPTLSGLGYAIDSCIEGGETLCAQGKQVTPVKLDKAVDFSGGYWLWSRSLGKRTLLIAGQSLILADGTKARVLSSDVPTDVTSFTGSERAEAWVVANGHVHHFAGNGWTR